MNHKLMQIRHTIYDGYAKNKRYTKKTKYTHFKNIKRYTKKQSHTFLFCRVSFPLALNRIEVWNAKLQFNIALFNIEVALFNIGFVGVFRWHSYPNFLFIICIYLYL